MAKADKSIPSVFAGVGRTKPTPASPPLTPYMQGVMEGIRFVVERFRLDPKRARWRRDSVTAVARDLWPSDGEPPPDVSTPEAVQQLGDECQRRGITASPDTLKRAIHRR